MVGALFFCVTLKGRIGGHTPSVQTGAETSDIGVEAVKNGETAHTNLKQLILHHTKSSEYA